MNEFEFVAEVRGDHGKGAMRRLRRAGKVPAVIYGAGKEPVSLLLDANDIKKRMAHEAIASHILTVKVNGSGEQAVLKDIQRDPASELVLHMDLLRINAEEKLTLNVPLHFANEDSCPGKKAGGIVSHLVVDVEVSCLPRDLPEFVEVDLSDLELDQSKHLSDIVMPAGVDLVALSHGDDDTYDQAIVIVQPPRIEVEETAEEEGEGVETPAGEEAAGSAPEGDQSE